MKPVAFALTRPATLAEALSAARDGALCLAGGQSLGPMLNLRLAAPERLMSIGHLAELSGAEDSTEAVAIGAAVTHAAIEDGRVPDLKGGILSHIAAGIAYRAVRTRGTIGGSLCHADPAADWPCTLLALGAIALTVDAAGSGRAIPLDAFLVGAFRNALRPGEVLRAVRIPKPGAGAGWGYHKACRKPGEFAHAMAAVLDDPASGRRRIVIGATGDRPLLLAGPDEAEVALAARGLDPIARHMQLVALRRALDRAAG